MKKSMIIFAVPLLLLGLAIMLFAGRRMLETEQTYREGNTAYEELGYSVRKLITDRIAIPDTGEEAAYEGEGVWEAYMPSAVKTRIYIPTMEIDFEMLRGINKDAVAWLYSPETVIDYPVFEADDYSYYLNHLPDGTVNANGSLFIDFNNSPDFGDRFTAIYGHHMKSGSMFGTLVEYKKQEYFRDHPYMYLYTEHGNFRIDLMYGLVIGAGQWKEQAFMFEENVENLLAYARENTTFESEVEYEEGDRIVALSTCSYEFNEARYVVLGVLRPEFS